MACFFMSHFIYQNPSTSHDLKCAVVNLGIMPRKCELCKIRFVHFNWSRMKTLGHVK